MNLLIFTSLISFGVSLLGAMAAEKIVTNIPVLGSFAMLTLSHNRGIAFSIVFPYPWQELLTATAFVIVCVIAVRSRINRLLSVSFGLIIGGAAANLANRMIYGWVTDYFAISTFPVFNLADSAITVGAILLLIDGLLAKNKAAAAD